MGKLTEIIKLLPKGLANIDNVINGYITNIKLETGNLNENVAELILKRRLICGNCEYMSENAKANGYESERTPHCTLCMCPIKQKTAVINEICGIAYWNSQHPEEQKEIKW